MKVHIKLPASSRNQASIPRKHELLDREVVAEFAAWIDDQLQQLEDRHSSFIVPRTQVDRVRRIEALA